MSHIRSALAAGLFLVGGAVVASAQQSNGTSATPPQQTHAQHARHARRGMQKGSALLKGVALSDAEKQNLKAVHAKYASQLKALRGQNVTPEQRTQARQLMTAERNELRGALTPANQAKFDENSARLQKRMAKRAEKAKESGKAPRGAPGRSPAA
jgi:Spy/CpxP family protein refolding chaperone